MRAVSSVPIHYDFGTPEGRKKLGFDTKDEPTFAGVNVYDFLMSSGDDVSCLNIAKPVAPRMLGVSRKMMERDGFRVKTLERLPAQKAWALLDQSAKDSPVPVFADADSAMWILHSGLGKTLRQLDDPSLQQAFDKASQSTQGYFDWRGIDWG